MTPGNCQFHTGHLIPVGTFDALDIELLDIETSIIELLDIGTSIIGTLDIETSEQIHLDHLNYHTQLFLKHPNIYSWILDIETSKHLFLDNETLYVPMIDVRMFQ